MLSCKIVSFCMALALACQALTIQTVRAQEIHWAPDIPTARKASMEYKVPMVIHFYGDNCLPCKVLEQNVLSRSEVIDTLNKYFICVRINASQERETAAQYGVHSWPTDVFVSPDGRTLDQGVCKQTAGEYLGVLHGIAVMNRDRNAMLAAEQTSKAQQVTSQVANYAQPAASGAAATVGGNLSADASPASNLPPAGQVSPGNPTSPNFYAQGAGSERQQLPHSLSPHASVTSGPMLSQNQPHALTTAVQGAGNQIAPGSQQHALNTLGQLPPVNTTAQVGPSLPSRNTDPRAALVESTAPRVPTSAAGATASAANAWNQPLPSHLAAEQSRMLDNPHFNPTPAHSAAHLPMGSAAATGPDHMATPAVTSLAANVPATNPAANPISNPTTNSVASAAALPAGSRPGAGAQMLASEAASSSKIPASTVSFQSRAALNSQVNTSAASASSSTNTGLDANSTPTAPRLGEVNEAATLALDGYCPVTLKAQGAWVVGQPQFAVKHRGRIYHLSSQETMREFLQHPDRCSPVMSGYDAMTFLNEGKLVEGSIQYGLHDLTSGSILLFTSAESKQAYEQNFDANTQALKIVLQNAGVGQ